MAVEIDEALEDERREHEYAQAALRKNGSIPLPKDGLIPRFYKGMDQSEDQGGAYVFFIDRTTGLQVMGYDGADPANTNSAYGAVGDGDVLARQGLDIKELIDPSKSVITEDALRALNVPPDGDWLDDGDDDYED